MPTPFRIDIPDSEIAALHARIDAARWPDQIGDPWVYGTDITYLKELCRYWRHDFDWRAQEAKLNRFDQFRDDARRTRPALHPSTLDEHARAAAADHARLARVDQRIRQDHRTADATGTVRPRLARCVSRDLSVHSGLRLLARTAQARLPAARLCGAVHAADGPTRLSTLLRAGRRRRLRGDDVARRARRRPASKASI